MLPALGLHHRHAAVWCGEVRRLIPASFQALLFSPLRRRQNRKLASCSQQGGFEQDNPFGQASESSM